MNIKDDLKAIFLPVMLVFLLYHDQVEANQALNKPASDEIILHELIARVQQMGLGQSAGWYDLLHYKQHVFGGFYSQVDDNAFFLSDKGKYDATLELIADIKGFFSLKTAQHPQCLFPARLHWLNSQLNFAEFLPEVSCEKFNNWKQKVDAQSVTLLFPSMYLHNPGSMFGHTFLRLNKNNNSDLLNYTLSYAAAHDTSDSIFSYIYKGINGGYTGVFSVQPYYETVQSYGDIEQRDIWEYSLNLNNNEVDQLVRHIWEVSNLNYDYYFFRENCSYRLLSLLDVARPGLNMTRDKHLIYAIPVDTVRSVEIAGLIQSKKYRPARNARIQQMFEQMDAVSRDKVIDILDRRESALNLQNFSYIQQARILESADEISKLNEDDIELSETILSMRSRVMLDNSDPLFTYKSHRPDNGHDSSRWHVAYGEDDTGDYIETGLRPAFHDLLDRDKGFVKGASITVLDNRLRWYESQQKLELESLSFFSMTSLSPIKPWSSPLSGKLDLGINQQTINSQIDAKVFNIDAALGYTFEWDNSLIYGLADSQFSYTKKYQQNHILSVGADLGALLLFENSRIQFDFRFLYSVDGEDRDKQNHGFFYQYDFEKNHGMRLEVSVLKDSSVAREKDAQLKYLMYF